MNDNKALNVLNEEQKRYLKMAIDNKIPIIIAGKHKPTGKSTLCDYLKAKGINAIEKWELEENNEIQIDENINTMYLLIKLNKEINV